MQDWKFRGWLSFLSELFFPAVSLSCAGSWKPTDLFNSINKATKQRGRNPEVTFVSLKVISRPLKIYPKQFLHIFFCFCVFEITVSSCEQRGCNIVRKADAMELLVLIRFKLLAKGFTRKSPLRSFFFFSLQLSCVTHKDLLGWKAVERN